MAKTILKKLGVFSVAKLEAVIFAVIGLISGIITAIITTMAASWVSAVGTIVGPSGVPVAPALGGISAGVGILAIVIMPIAYGLVGFIAGAIGAFLYNLIAGWIGGIEMEFDEEQ